MDARGLFLSLKFVPVVFDYFFSLFLPNRTAYVFIYFSIPQPRDTRPCALTPYESGGLMNQLRLRLLVLRRR
jgi:hypothetical protein